MNKRIRARARARGSSSFQPAKQLENPKQFTEAELKETKAWLRNAAEEEAKREAAQKAALAQRIRILRQKLNREAKGKGCTDTRRKEIEGELEEIKGIEEQECGIGEPKYPSSRPSTLKTGRTGPRMIFSRKEEKRRRLGDYATFPHQLGLAVLAFPIKHVPDPAPCRVVSVGTLTGSAGMPTSPDLPVHLLDEPA